MIHRVFSRLQWWRPQRGRLCGPDNEDGRGGADIGQCTPVLVDVGAGEAAGAAAGIIGGYCCTRANVDG
jgi:hypothetical protein